jgi:KUP system potassium uptake protein
MQLGKKGEGGTIVLKEIILPMLKSGRAVAFFSLLSIIGVSLLIGDGVITPSISVLSAVEGLKVATPAFEAFVVPLTLLLLVVNLFSQAVLRGAAGATRG